MSQLKLDRILLIDIDLNLACVCKHVYQCLCVVKRDVIIRAEIELNKPPTFLHILHSDVGNEGDHEHSLRSCRVEGFSVQFPVGAVATQ